MHRFNLISPPAMPQEAQHRTPSSSMAALTWNLRIIKYVSPTIEDDIIGMQSIKDSIGCWILEIVVGEVELSRLFDTHGQQGESFSLDVSGKSVCRVVCVEFCYVPHS